MDATEVTLAARGQIVIPKEARDALGLKPGARLSVRVQGSCLLIEKRVTLDLSRWIGKAVDDGLTTEQALTELRGRPVPWHAEDAPALVAVPVARKRTASLNKSGRQSEPPPKLPSKLPSKGKPPRT